MSEETARDDEARCAWGESCVVEAEEVCLKKLAEILGLHAGVDATLASARSRRAECAVYDIGHLYIGDTMAFRAHKHAFRGTLDLFNRSRPDLQRWIGRLLMNLPISPWQGRSNELEGDTNVEQMRVALETGGIGDIESATLGGDKDGKGGIEVFTTTVLIDVVFTTKERQ